ncbi:GH35 family endo-1,4-beta-xylanase [Propionicimonas paludicola]|uniref:Beta-xylanase n=1 Tax=Propionicimonas paludicola TaxID=185243 RepID=A0A2A9CUF8_9ACTN|nr:endo-1,4-beta-xylanase [Propionicimonas paludicola]PFG18077.1 GH35 family endo-1,4-beta-xylanase [Propionicimonas paludicola]
METVAAPDTSLAHRVGEVRLRVLGADGRPLADTELIVAQQSHAFSFGNLGFDFVELANGRPRPGDAELAERWLSLFNTATLPFYWRDFEPTPGAPRTAELRAAAQWFADRGVRVKGHPLAWHTLAPQWLLGAEPAEVEQRLRGRIRREVSDFAGLIDTWDAINELVIMPVFTAEDNAITPLARQNGRLAMARLAFDEARAANPDATLLINDFNLSADYEALLDELLRAGLRLDAIGLQTHMHQGFRGEDDLADILERFSRFGLPLHFTETSLVSGELMPAHIVDLNDYVVDSWPSTAEGEARQADELVRHYRMLVAHPAVAAITYWGITDADAWLGAPIGLLRADGSPKPSFDALHELIKGQWWLAPTRVVTDTDGYLAVRGFLGEYRAQLSGAAASAGFTMDAAATQLDLHLPGSE